MTWHRDREISAVENPENAYDYVIKITKIRELLPEAEIGKETLKAINQHVLLFILRANDRCTKNRRKRIFPHDL